MLRGGTWKIQDTCTLSERFMGQFLFSVRCSSCAIPCTVCTAHLFAPAYVSGGTTNLAGRGGIDFVPPNLAFVNLQQVPPQICGRQVCLPGRGARGQAARCGGAHLCQERLPRHRTAGARALQGGLRGRVVMAVSLAWLWLKRAFVCCCSMPARLINPISHLALPGSCAHAHAAPPT